MAVLGAMLFACSPVLSYAQYSNIYTSNQSSSTTHPASNITTSSATLNGSVSVISNLYTAAWFEYGINTNLGYSTPRISYGSGYFSYNYNISGLGANTTYYFRTVTQNAYGIQYGNMDSFTTDYLNINDNDATIISPSALTAITTPANSISNNGARLNGLILNKTNDASNAWFEWGTSLNLGNITTPISTGVVPSVKHVNTITGLLPGTTYYFRAVVENSSWRNNGSILSFVTSSEKQTKIQNINANSTIKENSSNENQPTFGAAVFGAGSFFPTSILGLLILLILVLSLIILSKHLYSKFLDKKHS